MSKCHMVMSCQVPVDWSPMMRLETYRAMSRHVGTTVGSLGVCNFSSRQVIRAHTYLREFL